jgi:hypothetical protein
LAKHARKLNIEEAIKSLGKSFKILNIIFKGAVPKIVKRYGIKLEDVEETICEYLFNNCRGCR